MSTVNLSKISKRYGEILAVDNLDLVVDEGEFVSLLGPSGCGKTTTLRMVAGLVAPDSGSIEIGGEEVDGIPPYRRNLGMVFQNYALFPHMTVFENIAFGLRMRHLDDDHINQAVEDAMRLVQLAGLGSRYPKQLSGGQQQRVALARAVAIRPSVLLLDEPLSNLDLRLRIEMRVELRRLQKMLGITTIFVTHDQGEALNLSDRIVVMNAGHAIQVGFPNEIYESPVNRFVASFIGEANFFEGRVKGYRGGEAEVITHDGLSIKCKTRHHVIKDQEVVIVVRPEKLEINTPDRKKGNGVDGRIEHIVYGGSTTRYVIRANAGRVLLVDVQAQRHFADDAVVVSWDTDQGTLLPDH